VKKYRIRLITLLFVFCLFVTSATTAMAAELVKNINGVSRLINVESISLINQNLSSVPEEIGELSLLKNLNVSGNQLTEISNGVLNAEGLESLDISNNNITTVPNDIDRLINLTSISIAGNTEVKKVPLSMNNLTKLKSIDVTGTQIKCLPLGMEGIGITDKKPVDIPYGLKVTYDTQGGSEIESIRVDEDQTISTEPSIPTKEGFVFAAWYKDELCVTPWSFENDIVQDHLTLYAKWNGNPSTIAFEENSGSPAADLTGVTDQAITDRNMPSVTRSGYTFGGWFEASDFSGSEVTQLPDKYPVTGKTYYAKWTSDASSIVFIENGGSSAFDLGGVTDQPISNRDMPTITRSGYTFAGWFAASDFSGSEIVQLPATYPVGSLTYYAKWTANASTISFEENSGSATPDLTGVTDQAITDRNMPTITRVGYTLDGWYPASDFSGAVVTQLPATYPVTGITYYAKWTINTYTIAFNSNGGSAVGLKVATHDSTITPPTEPTKANAFFDAWYKDVGLTQAWNFASDKVTSNMTLYAKWTDLPPAGNALETYTWEQIKLISESGKADDYFDVGHEKTAVINGQTYTFQIYGFAHDDKASGSGKAGITFGLKGLMVDNHVMNPNNQNYGGWDGSDMRAYLNGVTTTYQGTSYATTSIYSKLPADLKAVITPVKKYTSGGYGATALVTSTDNLFLFSEEEVGFGNYTYSTSGEGTQYPIFTDNASRIKTYPNTSTGWWWLRSASNSNINYFLGVSYVGTLLYSNASSGSGVAFGFAI